MPLLVTDSSSPNKQGSISCGPITVTTTDPAGPLLWFKDARPNGDSTVWNAQTRTVREGQNVMVEYDTDELLCAGDFIERPVQYSKAQDWLNVSTIGTGNYTFTSLINGTYKIKMRCELAIGKSSRLANIISAISSIFAQTNTYSNIIKIVVTKTSIEEI